MPASFSDIVCQVTPGQEMNPQIVPCQSQLAGDSSNKSQYECLLKSRIFPGRNILVVDIDETLVHSSLGGLADPDIEFPLEVQGGHYTVSVKKRPHVDAFLAQIGGIFEVVFFTASVEGYGNAVLDWLLGYHQGPYPQPHRLFRQHCTKTSDGNYVKDLSLITSDLGEVAIVDNSPNAF
eukprot:gene4803-4963_t